VAPEINRPSATETDPATEGLERKAPLPPETGAQDITKKTQTARTA